MAISSLGYIGVLSSDTKKWANYGTQVLGMENSSDNLALENDSLYLKMDDHPFRVVVIASSEDRFGFCGWQCNTQEALEESVASLRAASVNVEECDSHECLARQVHQLYRFNDPAGNQHEIFWGVISDFKRMVSPVGVSGFVTDKLGMGHVVLPAPNFDATVALFRDTLGFGLSDFMNLRFSDDPNEPVKRLWFMHCNARHHSLAFFEMPHPAGCVHCLVEVSDIDEVGRCEDRRIAHGVKLSATLGRHANDQMVSFYMQTPSNFDIEYGAEGIEVDNWDDYSTFESTVPSIWGHDFGIGQS